MAAAPGVCLATVFTYAVRELQKPCRKILRWLPGHLVSSGPPCSLWEGWQTRRGGERRAFCFPYDEGADRSPLRQQMVRTAVFWNGGPQGKGRTRHWNSVGVTCVIGALIFKMVIYCCCSSKDNSVEDHHRDVKLFPFLGRSHYFINHYFSFQKFPLCLGLTGGLKKRLLHKSPFSESLQISCKIACVVGSYFFPLQYCF